ncbi:MAG: hypothetical protein CL543_15410 [Alcanivorax sp.]|nr:hypothetical protein [Alcanivorax sp.]MAY11208.1 hypothetical protein [Alcanivorax sp.]MBM1143681.1 methyltransferase domain-containing protein [Alcanivorax sp. ZXX171]MBU60247.1 hypothetical protein [Alcanivorax sp.]HCE40979.1 hypothetical protein [Alcanivorax sp.]|tara:strand:- start:21242 stop:21895 length:654 start_codon:yes stop_codon:yes gene_type:complete
MTPVSSAPSRERVKSDLQSVTAYRHRKPAKHRAEMALVARTMPAIPAGERVLDAPCGAGRLSLWMARQGWRVSATDLGAAAVEHTRALMAEQGCDAEVREEDIFRLPWADRHFRAVVCFRLLHHFADADTRRALVAELGRVSDEHLLISYLTPWSLTGVRRWLRWRLGGRRHRQNHTRRAELIADMAAQGFTLVRDEAQSGVFHALRLAHFARTPRQ